MKGEMCVLFLHHNVEISWDNSPYYGATTFSLNFFQKGIGLHQYLIKI